MAPGTQAAPPQVYISYATRGKFAPDVVLELKSALEELGISVFTRPKPPLKGFFDETRLIKLGVSIEQIAQIRKNVRDPKYLERVPRQGADCLDSNWREWDRRLRAENQKNALTAEAGVELLLQLQACKEAAIQAGLLGERHQHDVGHWDITVAIKGCKLFIALLDDRSAEESSGCPGEWEAALNAQGSGCHMFPAVMPDLTEAGRRSSHLIRKVLAQIPSEEVPVAYKPGTTFHEAQLPTLTNRLVSKVKWLVARGDLVPEGVKTEAGAELDIDQLPVGTWVRYQHPRRNIDGTFTHGRANMQVCGIDDDGRYILDHKDGVAPQEISLPPKRPGIAQRLARSTAPPNVQQPYSEAFAQAVDLADTREMVRLLDSGAVSVNQQCPKTKATSLHWASARGHSGATQVLVNRHADVSATDIDGNAPLHLAVVGGHRSVVQMLLEAGADANAENLDGQTPLDCADRSNSMMKAVLHKFGAGDHSKFWATPETQRNVHHATSMFTPTMQGRHPRVRNT